MNIGIRKFPISPRTAASLAVVALAIGTAACGHVSSMLDRDVQRPAATEFGLGPRASARHMFTATLQPGQPLRLRNLQTLGLHLVDVDCKPVDDALIAIDGGMPEHSHGLPTRPRVQRYLGGGVYEIVGLRFSMRGWWELKLAVDTPTGKDSVTFNLEL